MGFQSSFSSRKDSAKLRSEINVTPFVDVMLVLLVIFMVTAPMMNSNIAVNLPKGGAATCDQKPTVPLTVSLKKTGELFFKDKAVTLDQLLDALKALSPEKSDAIYLEADKDLTYADVIRLMNDLSQEGFHKIVLVTQAGKKKKQKIKGQEKDKK
jgi:biopolymer transport protein TolR